jgi:hypothetical protein
MQGNNGGNILARAEFIAVAGEGCERNGANRPSSRRQADPNSVHVLKLELGVRAFC